ncbi:hypothetical protein MEO93_26375 [Dolichospermum sp. ST_sed3]|nr:hypothetical protein [Dolichospermum sp. ST_sed3]
MKKYITMLIIFVSVGLASAQAPVKNHREQLKPLSYLIGNWKGTATIQQQGKAPLEVHQEERITWQLDSMLINIEGIGKDPNTGKKNFHAYALIYFNPATQQLAMKSFTMEGRQTEAYFKLLTENQFEWGFDIADNRGKIKYLMTLSEVKKTWNEKGEFSPDGIKWFPFMSMDLVKQ